MPTPPRSPAQSLIRRLALLSLLLTLAAPPVFAASGRSLLLATTTSVQDSGLLSELLPIFTEETGIEVRAVAVGTGAALRMGAEGNADVLLTHAASAEQKLVESMAASERIEVMQNYFVLAGPANDPAGAREASDISDALQRIIASPAKFISRGDDSGTHKREVSLFRAAGLDPQARSTGIVRTGSGMGLSLQIAGQESGYILSDIGTYLAFREHTGLVIVSRQEDKLRNVYALLPINPKTFPKVHAAEVAEWVAFFQSAAVRERIAKFGIDRFGQSLFEPLAPVQ